MDTPDKFETSGIVSGKDFFRFCGYGRMALSGFDNFILGDLTSARPALLHCMLQAALDAGNTVMVGAVAGLAMAGETEAMATEPPQIAAAGLFADVLRAAQEYQAR